jgi:hypothetical protein
LKDVAVAITSPDGTALAFRVTDRSGMIDPVEIPVPDIAAGQTPDTGEKPYTQVNLFARVRGYEQFETTNLQVFPNTTTIQNLELIPLSELPSEWGRAELFSTPPQNL